LLFGIATSLEAQKIFDRENAAEYHNIFAVEQGPVKSLAAYKTRCDRYLASLPPMPYHGAFANNTHSPAFFLGGHHAHPHRHQVKEFKLLCASRGAAEANSQGRKPLVKKNNVREAPEGRQ
jgi:hypothetical protein